MALQALISSMDYSSRSRNDRRAGKEKQEERRRKQCERKKTSGFCSYKLKLGKSTTRLRSC